MGRSFCLGAFSTEGYRPSSSNHRSFPGGEVCFVWSCISGEKRSLNSCQWMGLLRYFCPTKRSLRFLSFIFLDQSVRIARCTPCAVSSSLGFELGNVFSKTISGKNSRNTAVDSFVGRSFRNMFFFHGTLAMLIALHKKTSKRPLGSAYDLRPAV